MTQPPDPITIVTTDGTYILPRTTDFVQAWPMETPTLAARTIEERGVVELHTGARWRRMKIYVVTVGHQDEPNEVPWVAFAEQENAQSYLEEAEPPFGAHFALYDIELEDRP